MVNKVSYSTVEQLTKKVLTTEENHRNSRKKIPTITMIKNDVTSIFLDTVMNICSQFITTIGSLSLTHCLKYKNTFQSTHSTFKLIQYIIEVVSLMKKSSKIIFLRML